jgi:hypothetical protein
MTFRTCSVGSSAVASSYTRHQQRIRITKSTRESTRRECRNMNMPCLINIDTHTEGMPHMRERLRNDKQHTHATMQKWEMIISYICQANIPCRACGKATAERGGIDDACVAEARLGPDEDVRAGLCRGSRNALSGVARRGCRRGLGVVGVEAEVRRHFGCGGRYVDPHISARRLRGEEEREEKRMSGGGREGGGGRQTMHGRWNLWPSML